MLNNCGDKQIRLIIKSNYQDKFYEAKEIPIIIEALLTSIRNICTNLKTDDETIKHISLQFVYFSSKESKFYFNSKRKHTLDNKFLIAPDIENTNKIITCDITSSEEIELLEKELDKKLQENLIPYKYPKECNYSLTQKTSIEYHPFGTQWVHDKQYDDLISQAELLNTAQFDMLRAIISPDNGARSGIK